MLNQFDKLVEIVNREIENCDPAQIKKEYLVGRMIPDHIPQWSMFHDGDLYATNDVLRECVRASVIKINFENEIIDLWKLRAGEMGDETYRYTISIGEVCLYPSTDELKHNNVCRNLYSEADKKLRQYEEIRKKEDAIKVFLQKRK